MDFKEACDEDNSSNAKTFEDLLEWRHQYRDTQLTENTSNLKDAVLRLIDHHQDVDQLFEDINAVQQASGHQCGDVAYEHRVDQLNVEMFVSSLQAHAQLTATPVDVLAALAYAKNLQTIISEADENTHLLNDVQQHQVQMVLDGIHKLHKMHSFSNSHFIKKVNANSLLPLELVWILHRESIMSINKFITRNLGRQNVFAVLTQGIVEVGLHVPAEQKKADRSKEIVQGFAAFLVAHGYPASNEDTEDPAKLAVQKASVILLDTIMNDFLKKGAESSNSNHLNMLELIRHDRMVSQQSSIKFFRHQLILQLTSATDIIVSQAILDQHSWTFAKTAGHVTATYRELLLFFKEEEIADTIQRLLEHEEVNWQALLSFISTFLVVCPGASTLIKGLINNFLSIAVKELDQDFLIIALLLARQAASEGPQIFLSYPQWFKETFGEGNTNITSKKSFTFLMKILTSLVPFEPGHILKAHIQKSPHAFAKCQYLLCDYILLAKTRLADLKETLEPTGIFSQSGSSDGSKIKEFQEQAESDVEQAIAAFEATNQIPHSIIEASIFKYPYFMGRFLPVLLTPRMLPDVADSRMKLIELLKNLGKIPVRMMKIYKEACEKELNSLLEGIDMEEDDCEILEPIDALKKSMNNLVKAVKEFEPKTESLNHQLAIISERLQTVLCSEISPSDLSTRDELLTLDMQSPSLTQLQVEVTEIILNGFCRACLEKEKVAIHWADNFVSMLSQFQPILKSLMLRLCTLLLHQGAQLELSHLHCLSILLVHLNRKQDVVPMVTITGHGLRNETSCGQFLTVLAKLLSNDTGDRMKFVLQLSTALISYSLQLNESDNSSTQVVPKILIEKFLYLVPRLYPDARYVDCRELDEFADEPVKVYSSQKFNDLCEVHSIKLALNQWIRNEILVQPHLDSITFLERKEYYRWMVNEKCLCKCADYTEICSVIFMELVEYGKTIGLQSGLYVHNGCLHHLEQQSQNATNKNGSQGEMLQLLQEMTQSTYSNFRGAVDDRVNAENCSWMMEVIQKRLKLTETENKDKALEIACIMNIVTSLPAHLLVSNTPDRSPAVHTLKPLISFVNIYLRENLMDTVCSLPLHVTSYFARMFCNLNSSCGHHLKTACPLLISSLLLHIKKLIPVFSRPVKSNSTSELFKDLTSLQAHAEAVVSSSHPLQSSVTQDADIWFLTVALFTLPKPKLRSNLQRLVNSEKILQYLFELSIADVAHSILNGGDVSVSLQLAQNILEICPESQTILTKDSILKSCVAPQTVIQMMSLALFRVYMGVSVAIWTDHVNKPSVLQTILYQHQQLVNLYTRVSQDHPTTAIGLRSQDEPISLDFMTGCFKFVTDMILKSNRHILQSLGPDVLQKATPEIQSEIRKRLF